MLEIKFKVTTSKKLRCYSCKKELYGRMGFIRIRHIPANIYKWGQDIKICSDCFAGFLSEINKKMKTRFKDFRILLRDRMLRGLK